MGDIMSDIETRLAVIEARFAISELRSKYCWYTTRGMRDEVVALFTEDGVFDNARNNSVTRGRAALFEYFSEMRPARRIPLAMMEVVTVDGDEAEGTCAMQSVGENEFCGHYIDRFRKVEGQWLFAERHFHPYWPVYAPSEERRDP
jgi:hypothetical protein